MKELTIEEKAKLYDKALERARKLKEDPQGVFYEYSPKEEDTICDYIFPELNGEENEGERIRKALINYLITDEDNGVSKVGQIPIDNVIAWLEKQGKQKQDVNVQINPSEYINNIGGNGCYLKNATQTSTCSKKEEKVDNQNCVKSVDDIKPKFKVGDWISNDMCDVHIASIEDGMYYFDEGDGLSIVFVDEHYHIWTIEDAMDGDVLVDVYGNIGIFEKRYGINWHTYCYLENEGRFISEGGSHGSICYPATKSQRGALMKAMTDAGYTFDFKNKELKKIENDLTEFENALADVCRGWIGEELGWKDYIIKNSIPLLEFAKKQFDEYEQKPAWSEEDEKRLNFCLNILRPKTLFGNTEISNIDTINTKWLKSLKDRIQPHKQWKPSEEQIKAFEHFVRSIGESGYASLYENNTKLLYSLLEQLKKL